MTSTLDTRTATEIRTAIETRLGVLIRRGWCLDGAGPARHGWCAVYPCAERYLGRTLADVSRRLAAEDVERAAERARPGYDG